MNTAAIGPHYHDAISGSFRGNSNMEKIGERLTEEVRKHVHLYDALSPHYKDTQMASDSWREISAVVGMDVVECARRWKMLRDKYVRFHKKMEARSGKAGAKIVPAFYLFLSWLAPHVKHRENTASSADKESIVSSSAAEGAPTRSLLENQESQQLFSPGYEGASPSTLPHTSPQPSQQQTSSLRKAAKRKRWGSDDGIQNHISQLEKRKAQLEQNLFTSDEESARFGQTVADMLRRVPEEHRPQAMFDVYKLLFERQQLYRLTAKNV